MLFTQGNAAMVAGKARIEEAKITGSPRRVHLERHVRGLPAHHRRPTTRLAYCTGMRRSPRSTSTMNATTAVIKTSTMINCSALHSCVIKGVDVEILNGARQPHHNAVKMMRDMPLPTPRSLICLAQPHDERVPVVSEMMVSDTKPMPGLIDNPPARHLKALRDADD